MNRLLLIYLHNKDDEYRANLEEAKIKNSTFITNPDLYKLLWPEDLKPKTEEIDDNLDYVVPRDEKELQDIFKDLGDLGFPVREGEEPRTRNYQKLAKMADQGQDISDIDAALASEIEQMKSAVSFEETD